MIIKKSKILKIYIIFPRTKFYDSRGCYLESYNKKEYKIRDGLKEDLTVDGYIKKHGSIEFKGKHYDTKQSYTNAIKNAGCVIKDW